MKKIAIILMCIATVIISLVETSAANIYDELHEVPSSTMAGYYHSDEAELLFFENKKLEGEGYYSPEEALKAYIQAFSENDIYAMASTFSIETFVDNYEINKYIEWLGAYHGLAYLPTNSSYSRQLNIEKRRAEVFDTIRKQYITLNSYILGVDRNEYELPISLNDGFEGPADLIDYLFLKDDSIILSKIVFLNDIYKAVTIHPDYSNEFYQSIIDQKISRMNAEKIEDIAGKIYIDEKPYLMICETIKYDGKWYINSFDGTLCYLMAISTNHKGIIPLEDEQYQNVAKVIEE